MASPVCVQRVCIAMMESLIMIPGADDTSVAVLLHILGFVRNAWANIFMRWALSQGCSRRQEIYIIEENRGVTSSSKCRQDGQHARAFPNPPRYSNNYQKELSTHHTRPRFAGAWVGARSSLHEPSEAVSGEDQ